MDSTDRRKERAKARKWWAGCSTSQKWELGDVLVSGEYDWRDWFDKKPSAAFINALDDERIYWEIMQSAEGYTPNEGEEHRELYECKSCRSWWRWSQLEPIGTMPEFSLELANCPSCFSTLSRPLKL